ncbi:MAG: hypothetical protein EPN30_01520 [Actinomycetota bacterium]|nr:MAG: hypothetical protein EPN30_01520 [Actinomycetota bacterium]
MSTKPSTTFLAIGDVHGQWDCVIEAISSATDILGHVPDLVLQVGDAEALRTESEMAMVAGPQVYAALGDFWRLQEGDLPCPVYFIGGNHEPFQALDEAEQANGGPPIPWGPNVYYLGRAGAAELHGLNIAWLSGIFRETMPDKRGNGKKSNYHYVATDIEKTRTQAKDLGQIDILVSHDWPQGIEQGRGTEHILDLNCTLLPQLHVCGHHHRFKDAEIFSRRVHALGYVPDRRFGWWRLYEVTNGQIRSLSVGG